MNTRYGEISEDDIFALEYKMEWYFKYGNLPTSQKRETEIAKADYGRQYERYVGYLFEEKGFAVKYNGIRNGREDGGIDLVARAPLKIRLIQCKRWHVPVNVDVISRLHGAVERFIYEERKGKSPNMRTSIRGVIATTGAIDDAAHEMARHFGIYVMSGLQFERYPAIKAQRITSDGGRFLLPFTPGYDKMRLDLKSGDCFFSAVRTALFNGFYYPPYHREILKKIYAMAKQQE